MYKEGFALLISTHLFIKYPIKMKEFGLTETKLFHFHGIFKGGGGFKPTPLNPRYIGADLGFMERGSYV